MTGIQSRQLEMMRELNALCESEGFSYVLSHESAGYTADNDGFKDARFSFRIMMPIEDIAKLESYVERNLSDKRFIESWENNPDLTQLKFYYVDKNSTVIDGGTIEPRIAPGASITIYPARSFKPDHKTLGYEHYIDLLNKTDKKTAYAAATLKVMSRVNKKKSQKKLAHLKSYNLDYIHKAFTMSPDKSAALAVKGNFNPTNERYLNSKKENCYVYVDDKGNAVTLPADLFTNYSVKTFDGTELRLYNDESALLGAIYGKNWQIRSRAEITGTDKINIISDPDLPYAEYLEFVKDDEYSFRDIAYKKRELNNWMKEIHNPAVDAVQRDFMSIRSSVNRIDIWYNLRNKRDELKKAYGEKDVEALKKILNPYLKATDRYYKEKTGFYIDGEIFDCAKLIWETEAAKYPKDYADKVYDLVPELYKNETPDEYFARRGTVIK